MKNLYDKQYVYNKEHWKIQTLSIQDVKISFILINVVLKKNQCLDIIKINELVGWLYFSFTQQLFWQHMLELECCMCIINNGMKSKNNIVLVTLGGRGRGGRVSVCLPTNENELSREGALSSVRKEVRFKAPCFLKHQWAEGHLVEKISTVSCSLLCYSSPHSDYRVGFQGLPGQPGAGRWRIIGGGSWSL